jgi:hypothetical protein
MGSLGVGVKERRQFSNCAMLSQFSPPLELIADPPIVVNLSSITSH